MSTISSPTLQPLRCWTIGSLAPFAWAAAAALGREPAAPRPRGFRPPPPPPPPLARVFGARRWGRAGATAAGPARCAALGRAVGAGADACAGGCASGSGWGEKAEASRASKDGAGAGAAGATWGRQEHPLAACRGRGERVVRHQRRIDSVRA